MKKISIFALPIILCLILIGCADKGNPVSRTGVKATSANIKVGSDGLTNSQRAIKKRDEMFNKEGAIQHLYIFSAFSGQALLYSTVDGKVMSSSNRLNPKLINGQSGTTAYFGIPIKINGRQHYTNEIMRDDGTYGSSIEYLYWWDANGKYHQHYVVGGQVPHICSEPLPSITKIIVNLEK